jgi:hypothetical protein
MLREPGLAARLPALRRLSLGGADLGRTERWRDIELAEQLELFDLMVPQGDHTHRRFVVDRVAPRAGERAGLFELPSLEASAPGTFVELRGGAWFVLGRVEGAELRIDAPSVALRHTNLIATPAGWVAVDMGSTNTTRVNGRPIGQCPLRSGDELSIGHVDYRFLAGDVEVQASELRARFGLVG